MRNMKFGGSKVTAPTIKARADFFLLLLRIQPIWTLGPFICQCKIENGQIVFCPPHAAAEDLLGALIYAGT